MISQKECQEQYECFDSHLTAFISHHTNQFIFYTGDYMYNILEYIEISILGYYMYNHIHYD